MADKRSQYLEQANVFDLEAGTQEEQSRQSLRTIDWISLILLQKTHKQKNSYPDNIQLVHYLLTNGGGGENLERSKTQQALAL